MKNILLISGSLRAGSTNTALLRAFEKALVGKAETDWGDINLPLFNEELEADFPAAAQALREKVLAADTVIIATPEYNRATSGALKNAIDWASRPYGGNAWSGKKILVVSASPGSIAGALAHYQVKQIMLHLDTHVLSSPEFMVAHAFDKFDEDGNLTDESTIEHVEAAAGILLR